VKAVHVPSDAGELAEFESADSVDKLLKKIEKAIIVAESDGNVAAMGTLGRLSVSLLDHKRKTAPIPKQDPNESPDMVAAATSAREKLHKYLSQALGKNVA
jgi:hypothetical protein